MKAMILAAGFGTRLLPLTQEKPKPLMPILGQPLLIHLLEQLKSAGVTEVVINLHHLAEKIKKEIGSGKKIGLKIHYSYEPKILGSGGGLKKAEPFLKDETFFLLNGDILLNIDFKKVLSFHKKKKSFATMVLRKDKNVQQYGAIGIDQESRIRQFLGKPNLNGITLQELMFTGVHVLEPTIFNFLPPATEFSNINRIAYPKLHMKEDIFGYPFKGYWRECGNPKEYYQVNIELLKKSPGFKKKIPGVKLIPPVWIGQGCQIGQGSVIGPNVILGENCRIGAKSQLSHSILWDKVKLAKNAQIKRMILGRKESIPI